MNSTLAMLAGFLTLTCTMGVLVMPDFRRALLCSLGATLGIAALLGVGTETEAAWAMVLATPALGLIALEGLTLESSRGWHNWFLIVLSTSALWFLSLFLVWTLEEAFAFPVEQLSLPAETVDILGSLFDQYLWAVILASLLAFAVLSNRTNGEEA